MFRKKDVVLKMDLVKGNKNICPNCGKELTKREIKNKMCENCLVEFTGKEGKKKCSTQELEIKKSKAMLVGLAIYIPGFFAYKFMFDTSDRAKVRLVNNVKDFLSNNERFFSLVVVGISILLMIMIIKFMIKYIFGDKFDKILDREGDM